MVTLKRKRSKSLTVLLFPVLAFMFMIGFCLYCIGERERPIIKKQTNQPKSDDVSILPAVLEEHEEEMYI